MGGQALLAEQDDTRREVALDFPVSDDQDIYLIDVILDIISAQPPEDIEDVAVHLVDILRQPVRLGRLAEVPQQQLCLQLVVGRGGLQFYHGGAEDEEVVYGWQFLLVEVGVGLLSVVVVYG